MHTTQQPPNLTHLLRVDLGDGVRVTLRVTGHGNAEPIAVQLADVFHQVEGAVEAAFRRLPLSFFVGSES